MSNTRQYIKVLNYVKSAQKRIDESLLREDIPVVITANKISNGNCDFEYDAIAKTIDGYDKTDENNQPACYNKTRRGIDKAWRLLVSKFDNSTTMYSGLRILTDAGLRMRSFCRMD